MFASIAFLLLAGEPAPFALVNGTGAPLAEVAARLSVSSGEWRSIAPGTLAGGSSKAVAKLGGEDCAWDIRARSSGGTLVWRDVNLCAVKVVTLRARGELLWVDYD